MCKRNGGGLNLLCVGRYHVLLNRCNSVSRSVFFEKRQQSFVFIGGDSTGSELPSVKKIVGGLVMARNHIITVVL
jgi:hypothetical protein